MIFVTVGTHEQDFSRLVRKIDELKRENIIKDEVFIQTGYTSYIPKSCSHESMIGYEEMNHYAEISDIIICHGGPGSIMLALELGKMPIVVPRQKQFNEHVDDHQVLFSSRLKQENKVIQILDIDDLKNAILHYHEVVNEIHYDSHTACFTASLNMHIMGMLNNERH